MKLFLKILLLKPIYNALIALVLIIPGHSLGWAIVILTILIRFLILPSTTSATRAQQKMKELQPELNAIKEKYKKEPALQGQKTMELYRKYKINPLGSCLPMLIQFPVLIILYYALRFITIEGHRYDLLYHWMPQPANLNVNFLGMDLSQPNLWVLPILAGLLQLLSAWQMMPKQNQNKNDVASSVTRQMMFIFPLMTVWFARLFPAALPLYWITSTAFLIVQQQIILTQKTKFEGVKGKEKKVGKKIQKNPLSFMRRSKKDVEVTVRKK